MRLRFFAVPAWEPGEVEEEVNAFLAGHRVLTVERKLLGTSHEQAGAGVPVGQQELPRRLAGALFS
ncbi:MAG: hypothetical protein U0002_14240 [Thermoanaerobaculia bacterium]